MKHTLFTCLVLLSLVFVTPLAFAEPPAPAASELDFEAPSGSWAQILAAVSISSDEPPTAQAMSATDTEDWITPFASGGGCYDVKECSNHSDCNDTCSGIPICMCGYCLTEF